MGSSRWRCLCGRRRRWRWRRRSGRCRARRRRLRASPGRRRGAYRLRRVVAAGDAVAREAGVEDAAVLEVDGFVEGGAHAHDDRALHLVDRALRIDDEAAVERRRDAIDLYFAGLPDDIERDGCRAVAADIDADRDALAAAGRASGCLQPCLSAAVSRTRRKRACDRLRRRNSTGSRPTVAAISSMWTSRAKWLAAAPSER